MGTGKRTLESLLCVLIFLSVVRLDGGQRRLDVTNFVVMGEGLAAGMADFSLKDVYQEKSFPAQMAQQMNTAFPQPLIQGSGIGNAPGFPAMPVRAPGPGQGAVRKDFPPTLFIFNLSVPGFRVEDAVGRRPGAPVIQQYDMQQTVTNLILGYPSLILHNKPLWTQLEYAKQMNPTFALVELGYYDVLEAAATGNVTRLPDVATFRSNYSTILKGLQDNGAEVLVTTIPDPMDTGYFTSLSHATRLVRAPADVIASEFKLVASDLLTVSGVTAAANQLAASDVTGLPEGSVVSAAVASQISARVTALNTEINSLAQTNNAVVYDLNALFKRVRTDGLFVGTTFLTADYLGGFYSLDGYYPGQTGQGLIANEILKLINQTYGETFPLLNLNYVASDDPAVRFILKSVGIKK